jgi:hypothetical protein
VKGYFGKGNELSGSRAYLDYVGSYQLPRKKFVPLS